MKKSKIAALLISAFCLTISLASFVGATTYSFSSNDGSTGTKNDLNDLDHYKLYVWGIDPTNALNSINTKNERIIGASISFANIYNWANEANDILKVYMVDNPKVKDPATGIDVWSATDNQNTSGTLNELTDAKFRTSTDTNYRFESILNLWTWTDAIDGKHAQTPGSSIMTGHNLVYNFDSAELTSLLGYLSSKNNSNTASNTYATFGLGFDPDCHYYNDGITFKIETAPVPEPGTMVLLGAGLLGLAIFGKRRMGRK